jgi:SAM-dependent methyltransferase
VTRTFKDHFSGHAGSYASARPTYPDELYDWLAGAAPGRDLAWDCGTGNGQAALGLARHFSQVFATDASSAQIDHAAAAANITYRTEPSEHSSLRDNSVDLVTVAQAYHWFDHGAFLREAERVLKPGGLLAVWTYANVEVDPTIDCIVLNFYNGIIGPFWPPERKLVEEGYRELQFPWPELAPPGFTIELDWDLPAFEAYLRSWSAVQRYLQANHHDPVDSIHVALAAAWGESTLPRRVRWPMIVRAFRLP